MMICVSGTLVTKQWGLKPDLVLVPTPKKCVFDYNSYNLVTLFNLSISSSR